MIINPSAIICYGNTFDEMKGNIIPIDYALLNNLKASKSCIVHKTYYFYNILCKGFGGGSSTGSANISNFPRVLKHHMANIRILVGKVITTVKLKAHKPVKDLIIIHQITD